jgi:glutaredoxin 3
MIAKADGRTSVPQIFIDGTAIGGSDELAALEASGALDSMLASG